MDIAKGIALLCVVIGHTSWGGEFGILSFSVPTFYFLSGYTYRRKPFAKDLLGKFRRLIIPYILFNIVLLFHHCCQSSNLSPELVIGVLYSRYSLFPLGSEDNVLYLIAGNAPTWFLTSLFVSYILFFIIDRSKFPSLILLIYAIITIVLEKSSLLLPWSLDTAFMTALFIYSGYYFKKKRSIIHNKKPLLSACLMVYVIAYMLNGGMNLSVRQYGATVLGCILIGIVGSILLVEFSEFIEKKYSQLCFVFRIVGVNSLIIFAFQIPFINYATDFSRFILSGQGFLQGCVVILLQIIFSLFGGFLLSRIFHRVYPSLF